MKIDGSGQQSLITAVPVTDHHFSVSPDGQRIAFSRTIDQQNKSGDIYVMNINGTNSTNLTQHPADDGDAAWSRDSQRIAFISNRYTDYKIYVMNADGSALTQLPSEGTSYSPAWSPDGQWIAFACFCTSKTRDIYKAKADGSTAPIRITTDAADEYDPIWSPNGDQIAFVRKDNDNNEAIYVINADESTRIKPRQIAANGCSPTWLPDGQIAFVSDCGRNEDIYIMNADGSAQDNLTESPEVHEIEPSWYDD